MSEPDRPPRRMRPGSRSRRSAYALALGASLCAARADAQPASREAMVARARKLELDTRYVPPPGDPLSHHAAGCAKVMCSAVFVTGLDLAFAWENVGYFTCPQAERSRLGTPVVDREKKRVRVTPPGGAPRVAAHLGAQGCLALPLGREAPFFTPVPVESGLPDALAQPWPMGDAPVTDPLPPSVNAEKIAAAVEAAFDPAAMTAAFVVTWKGRIVAERYGPGVTAQTPLESWSMGKSLTATLMGILIQQGVYALEQPAPIPQWQKPGDPRAGIRIADLLRMSSGIRIRAPQDPEFDPALGYPDHLYLYTGTVDSFAYAATRPPQWPPNTVGRYRNTDPVLVNYLIRLAVEKRGEEYLSFPHRALLDKIGMRTMVMETDPYGNFLTQGYELASARDWARLGNLYLQDGVWNGERILPPGFVGFVSGVAPAWQADRRPVYGGFFWVNGDGGFKAPEDAYYMAGAGGQTTLIVPSHDLVVVRLGHFRGEAASDQAMNRALALLLQAVPRREGTTSAEGPDLDVVLAGGRVIDPESGLDAVRHVGLRGDRIVAVSETGLEARLRRGGTRIDATGLVVAPGFIDLHAHGQSARANEFQVHDGVTTALELESGFPQVARWLASRAGKARAHYGVTVDHGAVRTLVLPGVGERARVELLAVPGDFDSYQAAPDSALLAGLRATLPDDRLGALRQALEQGLREGALGIGMAHQYYPGADRREIFRVFEFAAERKVPIFTHVRSMGLDAMQEVVANAAATGASLHIVHLNSSSLRQLPVVLDLVAGARKRGIDVSTEAYPYTAGSTGIESAIFDEGWREKLGIDYGDVQWQATRERLTAETFARYRARGGIVIIHMMKEEMIDLVMRTPFVMVASDGMPYARGAHPRSAGTFARVLGRYVRERGVVSLPEALGRMTLMPARRLEGVAPAMKNKGRLREGADADVTVFDPATVRDTATFEADLSFSEGIKHVLVAGTFVVRDGATVEGAFPGRAITGTAR